MKLGDLSITYVEVIACTMRTLGADPDALLGQYNILPETLASPDTRISIPRFMRIGHDAIQQTRAPWFGLEMGRNTWPAQLGLAGLVAMTAPDLRRACQAIAGFELLSSFNARGASSFSLEEGKPALKFYSVSPYNAYNLFVVDSVLSSWAHILSSISGQKEGILEAVDIEFSDPGYADIYRRYFKCPVNFGAGSNRLVLQNEALKLPVIQSCHSVHEGLKRQAERELDRVRLGLSVTEQVARTLAPLLDGETPELRKVASRLNMAPWTLRRRLQAEGKTYQDVLNATRRDLAVSYIRDTSLTLGEIAYLLGFGSAAAFQRAFRRWTGEAPGRYRENCR
ncbi:MAG: AraC family transcriptional regulator [Oceanospirillaceae bacterium TMED276]|nr:MAG: AraC family transcriptional regulator [Oceanospirillaceae bacterium TMED276]